MVRQACVSKAARRRGAGFTLVELLVVITIIGILIALLLPAVQAAREAARRAQCNNNIKQIGLGLLNYEQTKSSFPPGVIWGQGSMGVSSGTPPPAYHHTWITLILPYIEQETLWSTVDFKQRAWGQSLVSTVVSALQCPSDAGPYAGKAPNGIAITNYVGSEGFDWHTGGGSLGPSWNSYGWEDAFTQTGSTRGVFTATQTTRIAEILDGTSNTIIVCEKDSVGFTGAPTYRGAGAGARRTTATAIASSAFLGTAVGGWGANESGQHVQNCDGGTKSPWTYFRSNPNTYLPTFIAAFVVNGNYPSACSYHPGGIQALMCDGSSRFINENIDMGTWMKLNLIADNNTIRPF